VKALNETQAAAVSAIAESPIVIIGAGFFGLTIANLVAEELGISVTILESRENIGGNAYAYIEKETGIEVHKYGSHLFHTSNIRVWDFVNKFSEFNSYQHRVFTRHQGVLHPIPINLLTIRQIFGGDFNPQEAASIVKEDLVEFDTSSESNFESKAIATIGPKLYNSLIYGYTQKQWQTDPKLLPESVFGRLPVRFSLDSNYFNDAYQGLPREGYESLFNNMVASPLIKIFCNTDYFGLKDGLDLKDKVVIYTGPIDRYFDYKYGLLNWRTLDFELEILDVSDFQGAAVINEADLDVAHTRTHEFKHLHPEWKSKKNKTIIMREFSRMATENDEPYYPVNTLKDREKLAQYRILAAQETNTYFGGRLGSYQYLDMHMAIASAFNLFDNQLRMKLA
jgi:UDP-galactopyranose mutase